MKYVIYKHRNRLNDKSYVGCVVEHKGMMSRWRRHVCDAHKGSSLLFHRAIVFYGVSDDVWEHVELQTVESYDDAVVAEQAWIAKIMCNGLRENHRGYNMTDGGDGVKGYKHSDDAVQRIAEKIRGKKRSEETRERMRKPKAEAHKEKLRIHLDQIRALPKLTPHLSEVALQAKKEKLCKAAQLPHVKEAKRQAQLRRWAKWREQKAQSD